MARLGDLRNNNDTVLTFEGDNNVLLQQTSNHLISGYDDYLKTRTVPETPLGTMQFLQNFDNNFSQKFVATNEKELLTQTSRFYIFTIFFLNDRNISKIVLSIVR